MGNLLQEGTELETHIWHEVFGFIVYTMLRTQYELDASTSTAGTSLGASQGTSLGLGKCNKTSPTGISHCGKQCMYLLMSLSDSSNNADITFVFVLIFVFIIYAFNRTLAVTETLLSHTYSIHISFAWYFYNWLDDFLRLDDIVRIRNVNGHVNIVCICFKLNSIICIFTQVLRTQFGARSQLSSSLVLIEIWK